MQKFFGITDIGLKRSANQDAFYAGYLNDKALLLAVCDGMGGASGGKEASTIALEHFTNSVRAQLEAEGAYPPLVLQKAIDAANIAVLETANNDKSLTGMGTTLVCALCTEDKIYFASIGDSRIYTFSEKNLHQLSHDHSYVQSLVDSGQITAEQARVHPNRNIITKAIGTADMAQADLFVMNKADIDGILLCSDGLCGYVPEEEISGFLKKSKTAEDIALDCLDAALDAGAPDNVTVVVFYQNHKEGMVNG